ncbi:hypothetical protein F2Q68_00001102 [Brassica cretica]|uniref:Uncharacterized protein n=1 Tax=Brassica cretica TaxID=69181 RepID=A0A8S9J487_BRACR|nr:hypothetical protein F2Q68_00001102 [Brassica cretica]
MSPSSWSPVSRSHRLARRHHLELAPSSPSRTRSLRRHHLELAPSSLVSSSLRHQRSQARSVTTNLELAPKVIDGEGDRESRRRKDAVVYDSS